MAKVLAGKNSQHRGPGSSGRKKQADSSKKLLRANNHERQFATPDRIECKGCGAFLRPKKEWPKHRDSCPELLALYGLEQHPSHPAQDGDTSLPDQGEVASHPDVTTLQI